MSMKVCYKSKKLNKKEFVNNLFYILMLIFLFERNIFVKYPFFNFLFICGAVISFFSIFLIFI